MDSLKSNQLKNYWVLGLLAFFLILSDSNNRLDPFKDLTSNIFQPVYYSSVNLVTSIENFKKQVFSSDNQVTISSLQEKVNQLEAVIADYDILKEKYESLLKQSKTANKKYEYIQAKVYKPNNGGDLIVSAGSNSGVSENSLVVVGNVYVGKVIEVDENSSKVLMPDSSKSVIEVLIQSKSQKYNPIKSVAIGKNNEIIIDNIPNTSNVENGDLVIMNDGKIDDYLIVGTIQNIKVDKAASVVSASVKPGIDVLITKFVYIRK